MALDATVESLVARGAGLSCLLDSFKLPKNAKTELDNRAVGAVSEYIAAGELDKLSALLDYAFEFSLVETNDSPNLAFELQHQAFQELPLNLAHPFWSYLETRRQHWQPAITGQRTVILLRTLKGLLNRLEPVLHKTLVKDVLMYLALVFGAAHSARLNRRGKANTLNLVDVDCSSASTTPQYNAFWKLQANLSDPINLMSPEKLVDFFARAQEVARRFPIVCDMPEDDDRRPLASTYDSVDLIWNSDPSYFDVLESFPATWSIVSLQMLFVLDYILSASMHSKRDLMKTVSHSALPQYTLTPQEAGRATELRKDWMLLLQKSAGLSGEFGRFLTVFMEIENDWINWKLEGCPAYPPRSDAGARLDDGFDDLLASFGTSPKELPSEVMGTTQIGEVLAQDLSPGAFKGPLPVANASEVFERMQTAPAQDKKWVVLRHTREFGSWKAALQAVQSEEPPVLPDIPILPPREEKRVSQNGSTGKRGRDEPSAQPAKKARRESTTSRERPDLESVNRYAAATIRPDAIATPRPTLSRGRNLAPY